MNVRLTDSEHDKPLEPAHVADVAACKLACATARVRGDQSSQAKKGGSQPPGWIRRDFDVVLIRCSYDLRPLFEDSAAFGASSEGNELLRDLVKCEFVELAP